MEEKYTIERDGFLWKIVRKKDRHVVLDGLTKRKAIGQCKDMNRRG